MMSERKSKMALDVVRSVVKYFIDSLEVKDYGDKLVIQMKSDRDGFTRGAFKSND
jgi:hypothetical protein